MFEWVINELNKIDKRTRKTVTMAGKIHINNDVDLLCFLRKFHKQGLKPSKTEDESLLLSIQQHFIQNKGNNRYFIIVTDNKINAIIRAVMELTNNILIVIEDNQKPEHASKNYQKAINNQELVNIFQKNHHIVILRMTQK